MLFNLEMGVLFVLFWTPIFVCLEHFGFKMTKKEILSARLIAGVCNFFIGGFYLPIIELLGSTIGMVLLKILVNLAAYGFRGLLGYQLCLKVLLKKVSIAVLLGYIIGHLGLFNEFVDIVH